MLLGLLGALPCAPAHALRPDGTIGDFRRTTWGAKEGVPASITALAQTADGYLWIGHQGGVVRFDGLRFEPVPIPDNERVQTKAVSGLYAPRTGGLWVGFLLGGLAFLKDGQATVYTDEQGLPMGTLRGIAQDHDGTMWAITPGGLARLEGDRWKVVGADWNLPVASGRLLLVDSSGALWANPGRKVYRLPKGSRRFEEWPLQFNGGTFVESPRGEIWSQDEDDWRRLQGPTGKAPVVPGVSQNYALAFDRAGNMWLKDWETLHRVPPGPLQDAESIRHDKVKDSFNPRGPLTPLREAAEILVDREDNVWIVTGNGLERFSEANVRPLVTARPQAHVPLDVDLDTTGIALADDGGLWIHAGRGDSVWRHHQGTFERFPQVNRVVSSVRAADGTVWFCGQAGLWRYRDGVITPAPAVPRESETFAFALTQDHQGRLWAGTNRNLYRLADGRWTTVQAEGLPKSGVFTLHTDDRGRVWIGYMDGQLAVMDRDQVRVFSKGEGPGLGAVTALAVRGDRAWAGSERGLAVSDGQRFHTLVPDIDGTFKGISGIVATANGSLWINSAAGLVHVTRDALASALADTAGRVAVEVLGEPDGLEGNGSRYFPRPTLMQAVDGTLWAATSAGIYSIDPAKLRRNPVPPIVHVRQLTAGGTTWQPVEGMVLPEGTTGLRISYVGLSLTAAEKVRYRYRLEGVDADWQDARERSEVFYSGLAPRSYRFRVIAANNDGVWNETGATLNFRIPPTFVQTGWFAALCMLGAALVLWATVRLRVRQVARRLRLRNEAEQAERERIARELHDTLLQSTQGLILRFGAAAVTLPLDPAGRSRLEETLQQADKVMAEGRDRVNSLRATRDAPTDLGQAIADATRSLALDVGTRVDVVTEGTPRRLLGAVAQEALRITTEAITNAVRHAQGQEVLVRVVHAGDQLRVIVRDDGIGLDESTLESASKAGHWGLKGMRERADSIGGRLTIRSEREAGTEVELGIPAARAYAPRERRSRWRWWG